MVKISNTDNPTKEDAEELSALVARLISIILDAPSEVLESISDMEGVSIIGFFSQRTKKASKKKTKKKAKKRKRG